MRICGRNDVWSKGMFWAAIALTPLSILSSGHGLLARFVTGAAGAIFVVCLVSVARSKSCWPVKDEGEEQA